MSFSFAPGDKDIFLFDREELERITHAETVNQGLAWFKENRVLSIDSDGERLWASVEDDSGDNLPLSVKIEKNPDGKLLATCNCPTADKSGCGHMVAVLFAYDDFRHEDDGLVSAVETAISDRVKRAKSEVLVEAESGQPWFGSWRASSINAHFPRNYLVLIRSLDKRRNYCSCPDFAGNQLGTCKHIEAALHKIRKHTEYASFSEEAAPFPYVYLSWEHEEAPVICLQHSSDMEPALGHLLDEYFGADAVFAGRLPEDFFGFVELADRRGDVHIGEDALDWANHQARSAARQQRASKIFFINCLKKRRCLSNHNRRYTHGT